MNLLHGRQSGNAQRQRKGGIKADGCENAE